MKKASAPAGREFAPRTFAVGLLTIAACGGSVVLPVCVRRKMAWSARVSADSPAGTHLAAFTFDLLNRAPAQGR